jgi:hypothetical protein
MRHLTKLTITALSDFVEHLPELNVEEFINSLGRPALGGFSHFCSPRLFFSCSSCFAFFTASSKYRSTDDG